MSYKKAFPRAAPIEEDTSPQISSIANLLTFMLFGRYSGKVLRGCHVPTVLPVEKFVSL